MSSLCGIPLERLIQLERSEADPLPEELLALSTTLLITTDRLLRVDVHAIDEIVASTDISFLALDVDGVMTDGGLYYDDGGNIVKKFNVKDGVAINRLCRSGFEGFITSGASEELLWARAKRLGVKRMRSEVKSKLEVLSHWCTEMDICLEHVAYIRDDWNDLEAIQHCGLSACPQDAIAEIKVAVTWVLERNGGGGCVREFVDRFLSTYRNKAFRHRVQN